MKNSFLLLTLVTSFGVNAKPVIETRGESQDAPLRQEHHETGILTLKQMDVLKEELAELRGLVEVQQHELNKLKKSQQDYYIDLDKRLSQAGSPSKTETVTQAAIETITVEKPDEDSLGDKALYDLACTKMQDKDYAKSIEYFQDYVKRFPQGPQIVQAHYWLGEIYMAQWQEAKDKSLLDKASESFMMVTSHFPTHQKATDSLLKLGIVEQDKGNMDAAKKYFSEVQERYPGSSAARLAEVKLKGQ